MDHATFKAQLRCGICRTLCPHGCVVSSPNCSYNLMPSTTDSRCPHRGMVIRDMIHEANISMSDMIAYMIPEDERKRLKL